jgi:hypothetical protein
MMSETTILHPILPYSLLILIGMTGKQHVKPSVILHRMQSAQR